MLLQAEAGIRDAQEGRGLGDVYKGQGVDMDGGVDRAVAGIRGLGYRGRMLIGVTASRRWWPCAMPSPPPCRTALPR